MSEKKRSKLPLILVLLLVAVIGLAYLQQSGELGFFAGEGGGGLNFGDSPFGANFSSGTDPDDMPTNPYITLTITPASCQRENMVELKVESNFRNALFYLGVRYVGLSNWQLAGSASTDRNGNFKANVPMYWAGYWDAVVAIGRTTSNVVRLTIMGITIYTDKTNYNVGDRISGAISSTYKVWVIHIFGKNLTDPLWHYAGFSLTTDAYGLVRWGTAVSDPINPAQSGRSLNVIGIIFPHDQDGSDIWDLFEQYESYALPQSAFDPLVKSNILTCSVS